jgi:outer membrane protein OmpA-like peptidoglycan-associated protein
VTDFRDRTYSIQELEEKLFPEGASQTQSEPRMRGIAPGAQRPQSSPPTVVLPVLFEFNSDRILPDYYSDLDKLGQLLIKRTESRIQIEGYTDNIGSEPYNRALSERRAKSVKQYLVQHFSLAPERLTVRGYGKDKPMFPNDTDEGRKKNRRVEFVNIGK